jgi:hypothetical protein
VIKKRERNEMNLMFFLAYCAESFQEAVQLGRFQTEPSSIYEMKRQLRTWKRKVARFCRKRSEHFMERELQKSADFSTGL